VSTAEREAWLQRTVEQGCDVLLCHSGLVEVGLDLLAFPTIVCDEVIFSTTRVRQATRRSYRPGQTQPVKVIQLVYDRSMEARGLQLIASKIKSSLMVEGKLPGEGLAAFGQADGTAGQGDLLLELARSVLADEEGGARDVAGSLEATFRELATVEQEQDTYIGEVDIPTALMEEDLEPPEDERGARGHLDDMAALPALTSSGGIARDSVSPAPQRGRADDNLQLGMPTSAPSPASSPASAAAEGDPWARWRELRDRLRTTARPRRRASTAPTRSAGGDSGDTLSRLPGTLWSTQPDRSATGAFHDDQEMEANTRRGEDLPLGAESLAQASLWE
jgi:hypothetical protein